VVRTLARKILKRCDICGKPTDQIAAKLLYVPVLPDNRGRRAHSNYSHHADVGVCCAEKLLKLFQFQPRTTAAEYQKRRKAG
jgi:transcriptional regulator of met regulon